MAGIGRASGRMAARQHAGRCALVPHPLHPYGAARDGGPGQKRRGGRALSRHRGQSRRRHFRRRTLSRQPAVASASARIPTSASPSTKSCGSSNIRSACATARASCWPARASRPDGCSTRMRWPAGRRRWAGRRAASRRAYGPTSSRSKSGQRVRRWRRNPICRSIAWIFTGDGEVTDVWSAGRHMVASGRHRRREPIVDALPAMPFTTCRQGAAMKSTPRRSYRDIGSEILRRIAERVWAPGTLIPARAGAGRRIRLLARATVNRALQDLARAGIVERRRKAGTRVAPQPGARGAFRHPAGAR